MSAYFNEIIQKPTIDQQTQQFWSLARAIGIDPTRVGSRSLVNLIVQAMLQCDDYMWYLLSLLGANLTNIRNCTGIWLDIVALGFYDLTRYPSLATVGTLSLAVSSVGVTTITLLNPTTGVIYTGTNDGTTGTKLISFTASTTDVVGNCISTLLVSQLSTVSINNALADTSWITTFGAPPETDGQLQQRCLDVLIALSPASHSDALALILKTGTSGQITRCHIYRDYTISGSYSTYATVAAASSGPSAAQLATCSALLVTYTSPDGNLAAQPPIVQNLAIGGILSFAVGTPFATVQAVIAGLKTYLDTLPISDGSDLSAIPYYKLLHQINLLDPSGALNFAKLNYYTPGGSNPMPINYVPVEFSNELDVIYSANNSIWISTINPSVVYE